MTIPKKIPKNPNIEIDCLHPKSFIKTASGPVPDAAPSIAREFAIPIKKALFFASNQ